MVPLAAMVGGLLFLMMPSPAFASPDITISLTNAPSYCVNRDGGSNARGATVFLYACSGGNDHWYEADAYYGINQAAPPACSVDQCVVFEDYWDTNQCFGLGPNDTGTLGSCTNLLQFWIYEPGHILRNVFLSQDLVTGNDANRSQLTSDPNPIDWHQWTGP